MPNETYHYNGPGSEFNGLVETVHLRDRFEGDRHGTMPMVDAIADISNTMRSRINEGFEAMTQGHEDRPDSLVATASLHGNAEDQILGVMKTPDKHGLSYLQTARHEDVQGEDVLVDAIPAFELIEVSSENGSEPADNEGADSPVRTLVVRPTADEAQRLKIAQDVNEGRAIYDKDAEKALNGLKADEYLEQASEVADVMAAYFLASLRHVCEDNPAVEVLVPSDGAGLDITPAPISDYPTLDSVAPAEATPRHEATMRSRVSGPVAQ